MILVTGGAGFIGSVLVSSFNKDGREDIIIVDRLEESAKWKNLNGLKFEKYYNADLFFSEFPEGMWPKIDLIVHMGACSSTTEMNMDFLMKNNVEYSIALFEKATKHDIPIVYASSAATYGLGEAGYSDDHSLVDRLRPLNPYGYSKQLFDLWVLKQKKQPSFWYGIKFFNVFGPNEYHKDDMRSIVHKAFGQIMNEGRVKLFRSHKEGYKDGEQLRDFIYVKDCARAILHLLENKDQTASGIYNLGTGKARSFRDLVTATFQALGREPQIDLIDMPISIRSQYQYFTEAKMEKFNKVVPNFTFSALENSVHDYVLSHLVKEDPYLY